MKINAKHFDQLNQSISHYLVRHPQIDVTSALNSMRERWDIYWACGGAFSNAQEYQYLNDAHIDTAIKAILRLNQPQ